MGDDEQTVKDAKAVLTLPSAVDTDEAVEIASFETTHGRVIEYSDVIARRTVTDRQDEVYFGSVETCPVGDGDDDD